MQTLLPLVLNEFISEHTLQLTCMPARIFIMWNCIKRIYQTILTAIPFIKYACCCKLASYQAVVVQAGWQVCLNLPGNAKKEQYLHAQSYMVAHFLTDYSVIRVKEAKRGNVSTVIKKRFFWFNIGTMYVYLGKSLIYSIAQLWHHLYRLRRKCLQLWKMLVEWMSHVHPCMPYKIAE